MRSAFSCAVGTVTNRMPGHFCRASSPRMFRRTPGTMRRSPRPHTHANIQSHVSVEFCYEIKSATKSVDAKVEVGPACTVRTAAGCSDLSTANSDTTVRQDHSFNEGERARQRCRRLRLHVHFFFPRGLDCNGSLTTIVQCAHGFGGRGCDARVEQDVCLITGSFGLVAQRNYRTLYTPRARFSCGNDCEQGGAAHYSLCGQVLPRTARATRHGTTLRGRPAFFMGCVCQSVWPGCVFPTPATPGRTKHMCDIRSSNSKMRNFLHTPRHELYWTTAIGCPTSAGSSRRST